MAQTVRTNAQNSLQTLNQIQSIGNPNPPNLSRLPPALLQAANPAGSQILSETQVNRDTANRSAEACRVFSDVQGLRRLQQAQMNNTYYDSGCGWRYKPSTGLNPEVNRAALGSANGPLFAQTDADTMKGGISWAWGTKQLQEAEKNITKKICNSVSKCQNMAMLGRYQEVCGYCKTTGSMIPIEKQANGKALARFPKDAMLACEPTDIITNPAQCVREGFVNQSLDELANCKSPLTRDCVVLAARAAGCSDKGSLITALSSAPNGGDYDAILRQNRAFQAYRQVANPSLTPALVKDGSTGVDVALADFEHLMRNTQSRVPKLQFASKDLCVKGGEFEKFDFCGEFGPTSVIKSDNMTCAEKQWLQAGGTRAGTGFPTLARWQGKTFQALQEYITKLKATIQNPREGFVGAASIKDKHNQAMNEFYGTKSAYKNTIDVPKNDLMRGVEAVYFSILRGPKGDLPIVLGSDARLASKMDMVLPSWSSPRDLAQAGFYRGAQGANLVAMTTAFEIRPEANTTVSFKVDKTGGFVLAQNRNPFENMNSVGNDWGSWSNGRATMQSGNYSVSKDRFNVFVSKMYGNVANTSLQLQTNLGNRGFVNPNANKANTQDFYVTQSPLAPWMQYEICNRANETPGNLIGFFDTRWNGPCALSDGKVVSGFGTNMKSCVVQTRKDLRQQTPSRKAYLSFITNSWWNTKSYFAYTAFKTITLAVRPTAPPAPGERLSIFQHANFAGYSHGIYLKNIGNGSYIFEFENRFDGPGAMAQSSSRKLSAPAQLQKWNLVVLQYLKDSTNSGVADFHLAADTFENLEYKTMRTIFLSNLTTAQNRSLGALILENAGANPSHSGLLALGGTMPEYTTSSGRRAFMTQSFTGDIAWLHGFRNYLDTDEQLKNEIAQEWERRWPLPNLPGDPLPSETLRNDAQWKEGSMPRVMTPAMSQAAIQARNQMFAQRT